MHAEHCWRQTTQQRLNDALNPARVLAQNRRVDSGSDPVMWHSFGVTHIVRPEDFPVMPAEKVREHSSPPGSSVK